MTLSPCLTSNIQCGFWVRRVPEQKGHNTPAKSFRNRQQLSSAGPGIIDPGRTDGQRAGGLGRQLPPRIQLRKQALPPRGAQVGHGLIFQLAHPLPRQAVSQPQVVQVHPLARPWGGPVRPRRPLHAQQAIAQSQNVALPLGQRGKDEVQILLQWGGGVWW